jgi:hypothetical protein
MIYFDRLRKPAKIIQGSRSLGRDSNAVPPIYEAGVLITRLEFRCLFRGTISAFNCKDWGKPSVRIVRGPDETRTCVFRSTDLTYRYSVTTILSWRYLLLRSECDWSFLFLQTGLRHSICCAGHSGALIVVTEKLTTPQWSLSLGYIHSRYSTDF